MAWTSEQEKAIFDRGSNIIVSAGAGSGKTAVLSERILEYCRAGGDIRRILVLTFTKAAAMEMKERIRKKLLKNELYEQADYIDAAYITTFDSYSLALVKKYYYRLGISKDVSIMDSMVSSIKTKEIINSYFKELYEEGDKGFLSLLAKYTTQSDKEIVKIVEAICSKLDLLIDIDSFILDYKNNYLAPDRINSYVNDYISYAKDEVSLFLEIMDSAMEEIALDSVSVKLYDSLLELYNAIKDCSDYVDLYNIINNASLGRTSPKADPRTKEAKARITDALKQLKEKVFNKYVFPEDMASELMATGMDVLEILRLCDEVIRRLFSYKLSLNMFEFSDIARLAIRLVRENDDVKEELKGFYNEILVDEYQDTSDMQEAFLSRIENNNRYMVGDIKQSIYRFRNANPYIFKDKYDNYANGNGGEKIDLTYNFRSRCEVLDNINLLFNRLMTNSVGDAEYKKDHQMRYGQKGYEGIKQEIDFNLEVLKYDPEFETKLDKDELQAFIIGKSIKDIMASGAKVLKGDSFKKVEYSDFAILIDKAKSFVSFKRVFEYLNLPLSIEADLDLKDSILPLLFTNILILINGVREKSFNKAFRHAKASVARSFIYEYSDLDILDMLENKRKFDIDNDIYYLAKLDSLSYSDLYYEICDRLNIYSKLSLIGNVDNSLVILDSIHNMLASFTRLNMELPSACQFLVEAFSSDTKMPYTLSEGNKNSIRIMTIHRSKGLEFAYCYFPLLEGRFNQADQKENVGLDDKYGIYMPYADLGKSNTIIKPLVADRINKLDISEKVRLLYVALTRAREKMFLIMEDRDIEINPRKFKSFADMINYTEVFTPYTTIIDLNDYSLNDKYKLGSIERVAIKGTKHFDYNELKRPIKLHKSHISKEMKLLPDLEKEKSIELGTLIHECLEVVDFDKENYDELECSDFIREQVKGVLNMDILKDRRNARIFHEHEFYFSKDNEDYHGIIDLMLEYPDHIDIIDYKLSRLDSPEYKRQLEIYKMYVKTRSSKPISCYLLSILNKEIKKIEL